MKKNLVRLSKARSLPLKTSTLRKWKSMGKIVIIASHIFASLKEICDHTYWLEEGKIKMSVNPDGFDIMAKEFDQVAAKEVVAKLDLK